MVSPGIAQRKAYRILVVAALAAVLVLRRFGILASLTRRFSPRPGQGAAKRMPHVLEFPLIGSALSIRKDSLGFVDRVVRKYGNVAAFHIGPVPGAVLNTPDTVNGVLVEQSDAFDKGAPMLHVYGAVGQTPVLIREGEPHRQEREILDPIFQPEALARYGNTMALYADEAQRGWADGATIDIQQEMMALTLRIIGKVLLNIDRLAVTDPLGEALATVGEYISHGARSPLLLPLSIPTPSNLRVRRALGTIKQQLQTAINERRSRLNDQLDFLELMVKAHTSGRYLSDAQIRDDAVEIFNAAHENIGATLTWCITSLAAHSHTTQRLQQEVDQVLAGRLPTPTDLADLPYTLQVVKETLRLYPPIYIISPRRARRDVTIDGYALRRGSMALISPHAMQHRADYYPDPDRFDPDRFTPGSEARPPEAFLPFNLGPHTCAGSSFAFMEAQLVVATLVQRVAFELVPGQQIVAEPGVVLGQKEGCRVIVRRR